MADKDLKSLTIDGTTFRNVFTDKNIGKEYFKRIDNVTLPANTEVTTASLTISDPGIYLCMVSVLFATTSVTGATHRVINLLRASGGTTISSTKSEWLDASNYAAIHTAYWVVEVTGPTDMTPYIISQRAGVANFVYTYAIKLAKYPGVGGAVRLFRTLKNSTCCRPLNFGKAVA